MWTPSSLALRPPTPHRADALSWRPSPRQQLRACFERGLEQASWRDTAAAATSCTEAALGRARWRQDGVHGHRARAFACRSRRHPAGEGRGPAPGEVGERDRSPPPCPCPAGPPHPWSGWRRWCTTSSACPPGEGSALTPPGRAAPARMRANQAASGSCGRYLERLQDLAAGQACAAGVGVGAGQVPPVVGVPGQWAARADLPAGVLPGQRLDRDDAAGPVADDVGEAARRGVVPQVARWPGPAGPRTAGGRGRRSAGREARRVRRRAGGRWPRPGRFRSR